MILTLDNSTFVYLINPEARPPIDPSTGRPLAFAKERIEGLIASLGRSGRVILPTPALAEALVKAGGAAADIVQKINDKAQILVAPFDTKAAIELASLHLEIEAATGSKKGTSLDPWQKIKIDRQIVSIAKVNQSDTIYSDDVGLCKFAKSVGLNAISSWDLEIPQKSPGLFDDLGT
jgi:hypothetical protein